MDLGLKGRTAIVCGASAGLGLASAESLAEEGANVAMLGRRREQLEQHADRIGALAVRGDVTNAADLQRLVDLTVQAFGGIDIVVWNSGGPPPGPPSQITDERLEAAFDLLLGTGRAARPALPPLPRAQPGGTDRLHHLGRGQGARATISRSRTRFVRRSPAGRNRSPASSARRESRSTVSPRAASTRPG